MTITEKGVLIDPDFHDHFLTGIKMMDEEAHLYIRDHEENEWELSIRGVIKLRACEFLEGNIIFEIIIHRDPSEKLLNELYDLGDDPNKYLPPLVDRIRRENMKLLELNSSYGCKILILFSGTMDLEAPKVNSTSQP